MTDVHKAIRDPSSVYQLPSDVLKDDSLSHDDKLKILRQWEYDAKEILRADEENMVGNTDSMLCRVLQAIRELEK